MNRIPLTLACIALMVGMMPALSQGQTLTAYDFLRIQMSPHASALGNSYVSGRNDASMVFLNPAAMSTLEKPAASIGFVKHLLDVNAGYVAYGQEVEGIGWFGGGIMYVNYGSFESRDKFANVTGSFGAADLAVSAAYANRSDNLHYGGAVKVIYSSIEQYNSSALALDAGVEYVIASQEMVLGASVLNLGTQISKYGNVSETLPFDIKIGVSKKLEHLPLLLHLNLHKLNEFDFSTFSFGGEFLLSKSFRARVGYNNEIRRELKIGDSAKLAGFSAGFGLNVATYVIDYAFNSFGQIGALHRFGLSTTF
jgi:hypothetical protein